MNGNLRLNNRKTLNRFHKIGSYEIERLLLVISLMENSQEFLQLLEDLLFPSEREALCKRFQIIELLTNGYSYEEIQNRLGVSMGTIAKVSAHLSSGRGGYKVRIERIENGKKNNSRKKHMVRALEEQTETVSESNE